MEKTEIWNRLADLLRDFFEDPAIELSDETVAGDIEGWDSISHVELMVLVEEAFSIRFHTAELAALANVGEMVDAIHRRRSEGTGA